jgi:glycosyltransferase involved in cell wall biosynthesis
MKSQLDELAIIIPAYNEVKTIDLVLKKAMPYGTVFLVDDGSIDDTLALVRKHDVEILRHKKNMGYDEAISTGLGAAIVKNFKYAITFDADGQHQAEDISKFFMELKRGAGLVVGSRRRLQRWSEVVSALISKKLWGVDDLLCGMKGYNLSKVKEITKINTYKSGGTELAIRLIKMGISTSQIPIHTFERHGESRYGEGMRINLKILLSTIRGIFL